MQLAYYKQGGNPFKQAPVFEETNKTKSAEADILRYPEHIRLFISICKLPCFQRSRHFAVPHLPTTQALHKRLTMRANDHQPRHFTIRRIFDFKQRQRGAIFVKKVISTFHLLFFHHGIKHSFYLKRNQTQLTA